MQKLALQTIRETFNSYEANPVSLDLLPDCTVTRGNNNLDTCYQYAVQDSLGCKVLNIKFYDKIIDLVSREATHPVGSRIATIVGASNSKDAFHHEIRECLRTGMTRVEVSVCPAAFAMYDPKLMLHGYSGYKKMQGLVDLLISNVLNNTTTL